MDITLEKIELIKDKTGVTYKQAKELLEAADGSVVDAIIMIEESIGIDLNDEKKGTTAGIIDAAKETLKKGNMSRILVRKDDQILINLPLTVSVLGVLVAPWGIILGIIAAVGSGCEIEFINDKGETTDVNGKVKESYENTVSKGKEYYSMGSGKFSKMKVGEAFSELKQKGSETLDKIKESEVYQDIKEVGSETVDKIKETETYQNVKEKGSETLDKIKESEAYQDVKKIGSDTVGKIKESGTYQNLKEKGSDVVESVKDLDAEGVKEKAGNLKNKAGDLVNKATDKVNKVVDDIKDKDDEKNMPLIDIDDVTTVVDEVEKELDEATKEDAE